MTAPQLVISLSLPRTYSVAIFQAFANGSYFNKSYHEPSIQPYDGTKYPEITKDWFVYDSQSIYTFGKLSQVISKELQTGKRIFIKDMVFSSMNWLLTADWLPQNTVFLFWIRNPWDQMCSLYPKLSDRVSIMDEISSYRELECMRNRLKEKGFRTLVCDADEMLWEPQEFLGNLCSQIKLPTSAFTTHWSTLTPQKTREQYGEAKTDQMIEPFHGEALKSKGFQKYHPASKLVNDYTYFPSEDRFYLIQFYQDNLKYYTQLRK